MKLKRTTTEKINTRKGKTTTRRTHIVHASREEHVPLHVRKRGVCERTDKRALRYFCVHLLAVEEHLIVAHVVGHGRVVPLGGVDSLAFGRHKNV